jgi:hypothetical protein
MDERSPDLLRPTLTAGILFGALASVPFLSLINCACCALVLGCGFFASWLYSGECRRQTLGFRPGAGAMVGLVSGAFYAVTESVLGTGIRLAVGDPTSRAILPRLRNLPDLPAELRDALEQAQQASEATPTFASFVLAFFMTVLIAAAFSTLGGLIGGAVFRVSPPAPTPPPADDGYVPPPSAPAV